MRALHRLGKQLAIEAVDGRVLVVQLGMSGQLLTTGGGAERRAVKRTPPQATAAASLSTHRHLAWHFTAARDRSGALIFRDPRRFGGVSSYASMDALRETAWGALGPDALTIDAPTLALRLRGARAIKAALLDQAVLAGVGNIYADEALFRARVRPTRRAGALTHEEIECLATALRSVLASAVQHDGSTLRDYRAPRGQPGRAQLLHAVYGRAGELCLACRCKLRHMRLAGRTTTWCPTCQRASRTPAGRER